MIEVSTKKTFRVNVIILICAIVTLFLLFFTYRVDASTSTEFPSAPTDTSYPYYLVVKNSSGSYYCYTMKSQQAMTLEDTSAWADDYNYRLLLKTGDCNVYELSSDLDTWVYDKNYPSGVQNVMKHYDSNKIEITESYNKDVILRSNYHVYYFGGVFFRRSPLEVVRLNKELAKANPMEIVEVVVGLIQLLMLSIVAFVSFRKSWQFLRRQLGQ